MLCRIISCAILELCSIFDACLSRVLHSLSFEIELQQICVLIIFH